MRVVGCMIVLCMYGVCVCVYCFYLYAIVSCCFVSGTLHTHTHTHTHTRLTSRRNKTKKGQRRRRRRRRECNSIQRCVLDGGCWITDLLQLSEFLSLSLSLSPTVSLSLSLSLSPPSNNVATCCYSFQSIASHIVSLLSKITSFSSKVCACRLHNKIAKASEFYPE